MATLVIDGDCGVCRRWGAWFAARQRTDHAVRANQEMALDDAVRRRAQDSVLWLDEDRVLDRSAACIRALWAMRGGWPLAGTLLWLIPKPIRDAGYRWYAAHR